MVIRKFGEVWSKTLSVGLFFKKFPYYSFFFFLPLVGRRCKGVGGRVGGCVRVLVHERSGWVHGCMCI